VRPVELSDTGVADEFMRHLGSELEPGKAALIVLVTQRSPEQGAPRDQGAGTVIQTSRSNEDETALQTALDAARR
jgi:uncharacterized membrane protein